MFDWGLDCVGGCGEEVCDGEVSWWNWIGMEMDCSWYNDVVISWEEVMGI